MYEEIFLYLENNQIAKASFEEVKKDVPIVDLVETTEIIEEETTEQSDIEYITTEGQVVDTRLYLSSEVNGADLNDIYSLLLSIRNLFVLFMLMFIFFKVKNIIHSVLAKIFESGK